MLTLFLYVLFIESSSSPPTEKIKKVKKGQLKETQKQKLAEVSLSKKFKQSLTVKKLKDKLNDSETLSLLAGNDSSLAAASEAAESDDAVSSTRRGSRLKQPIFRVDERRQQRIEARRLRRQRQKVAVRKINARMQATLLVCLKFVGAMNLWVPCLLVHYTCIGYAGKGAPMLYWGH